MRAIFLRLALRLVRRFRANRRLSRIIRDANSRFGPWGIGTTDYHRYIVERAFWEVR